MSLSEKLKKLPGGALSALAKPPSAPRVSFAPQASANVSESDDLTRVLALPRRPVPSQPEQVEMALSMTARLRRDRSGMGPCACAQLRPEVVARGQNPCITELRPLQGWYLTEAAKCGGALGFVPVGGGKTGIDILTPMVVPPRADGKPIFAVLLIPPGLRAQFALDFKVWAQHFQVPNLIGGSLPYVQGLPRLEVFAYSELSIEKNSTWLKVRNPDVVLADESHSIRDRKSTRTGRFLRFFAERETEGTVPGFYCHDGSMTTRGIEDYVHLAALSLKDGSPAPHDPNVAAAWGEVINPQNVLGLSTPGALKRLCAPGETIRTAWQRRLTETPGVIVTSDAQLGTKLIFSERVPPPLPPEVSEALDHLRKTAQRPDGEELVDQLQVAACARQVAAGLYLYWRFPRGESEELIKEWFDKRQAWNRELRERLMHRADNLDSPALLRGAAERYHSKYAGSLPVWASGAWPEWRDIADKVQPVTAVKWISDWLARDAAAWGKEAEQEGRPGIIWYENSAVGRKIAEIGEFPFYGAGDAAAEGILSEKGDRTIVASLKAHGVGRNLQSFANMLFVQLPSDAGAYEQALGRCHRPGQPRDEVRASFYQHVPEYVAALEKASGFSDYIQATTGAAQKLMYGEWVKGAPLRRMATKFASP